MSNRERHMITDSWFFQWLAATFPAFEKYRKKELNDPHVDINTSKDIKKEIYVIHKNVQKKKTTYMA